MRLRSVRSAVVAAVAVLTVAGAGLVAPGSASAAPAAGSDLGTVTSQVSGTFTDTTGGAGTFTGTFTPSRFSADGDKLSVAGTLAGTLVDSLGVSQAVSQEQSFPVRQISPGGAEGLAPPLGCEVLDLDLGPLDLDLLGLVVNLDEVLLNITAVPGAGNLLGNLLCAVVGLLDGVGTIAQIVLLLNLILQLLGMLGG